MTEIVDIRGAGAAAPPSPVLADPSGRRRRALANAGRVVAGLFLLWLLGLGLAGLGLLPAGDVPLGRALASQAPSPLVAMPKPRQPSASDLAPARPRQPAATAGGAGSAALHHTGLASRRSTAGGPTRSRSTGNGQGSASKHRPATPRGPHPGAPSGAVLAPGQTVPPSAPGRSKATPPGNSGSAPAHQKSPVRTSPLKPGAAPAHQKTSSPVTTSPGKSGSAPGQATTTTTAVGSSGSSPGHTVPRGNGRGSGA